MQLRKYQTEALEAIIENEKKGIKRPVLVIATGGGKTEIFSHLPKYRPNSLPMLVLAHRAELLHQAKDKILKANPELKVDIFNGTEKEADTNSDVVVASVQTLGRSASKAIKLFPKDHFKVIITDEMHHAAGQTYKNVYNYFNVDLSIGVTATPRRADKVGLTDVFDEIVYYKPVLDLMDEGYLAPLVGYRITTHEDLDNVAITAGDYAIGQLGKAVDTPDRNKLILHAYNTLLKGKKTVIFCVNVEHAVSVHKMFQENNIIVASIFGTTAKDIRATILDKFKNKNLDVIVNVGVLTEGFDAPMIEGIILARPTKSEPLYSQMVGRGTRLYEGKENCIVVDLVDITSKTKPATLPTLLGLPTDFDLAGEDVREAKKKFEEIKEIAPTKAINAKSFEELHKIIEEVNLFHPENIVPKEIEYSPLIWNEVSDDQYMLKLDQEETIQISSDAIGIYTALLKTRGKQDKIIALSKDIKDIFRHSDNWVKFHRASLLSVITHDAKWRKDAPSEKQIAFLKRKGLPITKDMTKGQATAIINKYIEQNPRSAAQNAIIKKAKQIKDF